MSILHTPTWIPIPDFLHDQNRWRDKMSKLSYEIKSPSIPFNQAMIDNMTPMEYKKYVAIPLNIDAEVLVSGVENEMEKLQNELDQTYSRSKERGYTIEQLTYQLEAATNKLKLARETLDTVNKLINKSGL